MAIWSWKDCTRMKPRLMPAPLHAGELLVAVRSTAGPKGNSHCMCNHVASCKSSKCDVPSKILHSVDRQLVTLDATSVSPTNPILLLLQYTCALGCCKTVVLSGGMKPDPTPCNDPRPRTLDPRNGCAAHLIHICSTHSPYPAALGHHLASAHTGGGDIYEVLLPTSYRQYSFWLWCYLHCSLTFDGSVHSGVC